MVCFYKRIEMVLVCCRNFFSVYEYLFLLDPNRTRPCMFSGWGLSVQNSAFIGVT